MTRRGWWLSGGVLTVTTLLSGAFWTYQHRLTKEAAICSSCDARHQHLARRPADMAQITSGSLALQPAGGVSE
jgi:hypothetical protein